MKYKPQLDQAFNNCCILRFSVVCTGTCFIQKIYATPLPYFKVNIFPLPLPHFASIFLSNSSKGARYLYLNMAVEKRNISGV